MKRFNLGWLLFLIACSSPKQETTNTLVGREEKSVQNQSIMDLMSAEDLKIHHCLQDAKGSKNELWAREACLKGTPYEQDFSRMPSSNAEIIDRFNWFFDSQSNLDKFYKLTRGFIRARKKISDNGARFIHGKGIAVNGEAYVGVGAGWAAEFMNHQNKIGLFCTPSVSVQTDVGIDAGFTLTQSLGCADNRAFGGQGLNLNTGISGELIGAPVGIDLSYGLGIELNQFVRNVKAHKNSRRLNFAALALELGRFNPSLVTAQLPGNKDALVFFRFSLMTARLFHGQLREPPSLRGMATMLRRIISENRSLGSRFKQLALSSQLNSFFDRNSFPQMKIFFKVLAESLNGCDSIGGGASIGLSLSPVSIGVSYSNTSMLYEMPLTDLITIAKITPLNLMNPFLINVNDLRVITRMSQSLLTIPQKYRQNCHRLGINFR